MNYIRHLNYFFHVVKHDDRLTAMHVSLYMGLFQVWNSNRFRQPFPVYRDHLLKLSRIGSKNTYHKCLKELHAAGYIQVQPGLSKYMPAKIIMRDFEKHPPPAIQSDLFEYQEARHKHSQQPIAKANSHSDSQLLVPLNNDLSVSAIKNSRSRADYSKVKSGPAPVPSPAPVPPNIDPYTVPDLRPLTKQVNILKQSKEAQEQFHATNNKKRKRADRPEQPDAVVYFRAQGHPEHEARKFFLYYQALDWKLQGGKAAIKNWKAVADKWILNNNAYGHQNANSTASANPLHTGNDKDFARPL